MVNQLAQFSPLDAATYVQQQGEMGRQRGQQNKLAELASQSYSAPAGQQSQLLGQMAAIDPRAAQAQQQQFESAEDRRNKTLANMSNLLVNAPEQARPGLYQQMLPTLKQFGVDAPAAYDATTAPVIDQTARALYTAYSGGGAAGMVQSQKVGEDGYIYNTFRDGRIVNTGVKADSRTQLRDQAGIAPSLVNLRTGVATPLNEGGQPPQQEMPGVYIDPSLPPEVQAQIRQAEATGGQVPGQMFINQTGQGGGVAGARPAISPAEQARLDLAQQANARAAEAERRAQESADRAARGTPPAGYRWKADGSGVEPIPGAPSNAAVGSEDERKAAGWYGQATRALANMRAAVAEDKDADTPGLIETYIPNAEIANRSRDPARQRYANASSSLAEALLRAATGAGVNESEARQKILEVTPQRGDSKEVKTQKMKAAEGYLADLQARAGRALRPTGSGAASSSSNSSYSDLWK